MNSRIFTYSILAALLVGAIGFYAGHVEGSASQRSAERKAALEANAGALQAIAPKLERATAVKETRKASSAAAHVEYSAARSRIHIVDTMSLQIDGGPVLQLPAPVIQTVTRGDVVMRRDSLEKVSLEAWGNLWKDKAQLLEQRVVILEGELAEERAARRRQRIRDIVTVGAIGGALGVILSHVQVIDVLHGPAH